jgi:hypothetical protein
MALATLGYGDGDELVTMGFSVGEAIEAAVGRPKLFGLTLAKVIAGAMGKGLLPATITRTTYGPRDALNPAAGPTITSTVTHNCRGFTESYDDRRIDGTLILRQDRRILLLGGTLPDGFNPAPGDIIAIQNADWKVIAVHPSDPAEATFVCQGRPE